MGEVSFTMVLLSLLAIPNGKELLQSMPSTPFALFALVMTAWITITYFLVRSLVTSQGRALNGFVSEQTRLATTLETFGLSVSRSLTLVEERLARQDRRNETIDPLIQDMKSNIATIMHALVNSAIIPLPEGRKMEAKITREGAETVTSTPAAPPAESV